MRQPATRCRLSRPGGLEAHGFVGRRARLGRFAAQELEPRRYVVEEIGHLDRRADRRADDLDRHERAVVVTIFPDAAEKYLSERFWDESEGA